MPGHKLIYSPPFFHSGAQDGMQHVGFPDWTPIQALIRLRPVGPQDDGCIVCPHLSLPDIRTTVALSNIDMFLPVNSSCETRFTIEQDQAVHSTYEIWRRIRTCMFERLTRLFPPSRASDPAPGGSLKPKAVSPSAQ